MPIEISDLTFEKARKYLPDGAMARTFEQELLELLEEDDFWQNARRYNGPLPLREDFWVGMELLRKSYTPILKVRECLRRQARGVIGREPQFETVLEGIPRKKERGDADSLADAADKVQGDVWDERGEHKLAKRVARRLLSASEVFLRYDVPPGLLKKVEADGQTVYGVDETDWRKAYRLTHMGLCAHDSAAVVVDPATMREIGFYHYSEPKPGREDESRGCIQISAVDENGITQVRIVKEGDDEAPEFFVDTGGFPLVLRAEVDPVVTKDLLQLQDIACSIGTMVKINADVAGFPQVDTIDTEEPSREVPDPTNPGQTKRVPAAMPTGPRTMRSHYSYLEVDGNGEPITDSDGKPAVRRGSVQYREPVSSQPLRDDIEFFNTEIYRAMNQAHVASRRSANSSAEMLVQERADYADSLLEIKPDLEGLLRNVFKARLCMAAHLARDTDTLAQFKAGRARVDLRLNAGPISQAEKSIIMEQRSEGLMSDETAMVLLGDVDDVEAETLKIEAQRATANGLNSVPMPKAKAPARVANGT